MQYTTSGYHLSGLKSSGKKGNCFSLVMQLYSATYQEALMIIKTDFSLKKDFNPELTTKQEYSIRTTDIKIKSVEWTTKYLEYWEQYNISKECLIKFNVVPISYYWVNHNRFKCEYSFAYLLQGKYKILQPYDELFKWISNTNSETVQGLTQLNHPKDIIITSSLKDVMSIWEELNIQAIAPSSENTMLPNWVIEKLKLLNTTIWFDSDEPGIIAAEKYREYGFRIFNHDGTLGKDPSDCIKNGYDLKSIWNEH